MSPGSMSSARASASMRSDSAWSTYSARSATSWARCSTRKRSGAALPAAAREGGLAAGAALVAFVMSGGSWSATGRNSTSGPRTTAGPVRGLDPALVGRRGAVGPRPGRGGHPLELGPEGVQVNPGELELLGPATRTTDQLDLCRLDPEGLGQEVGGGGVGPSPCGG